MREIKIKVYKFDELSDDAKEKARNFYRQGNDGSYEWDYIKEDAENIGLKIASLDQHRANAGSFVTDGLDTAKFIRKNHGKNCETYKTMLRYWESLNKYAGKSANDLDNKENEEMENTDDEFLNDLLEDYRVMLEQEIEYINSDEQIDESIRANDYEFYEEGKPI